MANLTLKQRILVTLYLTGHWLYDPKGEASIRLGQLVEATAANARAAAKQLEADELLSIDPQQAEAGEGLPPRGVTFVYELTLAGLLQARQLAINTGRASVNTPIPDQVLPRPVVPVWYQPVQEDRSQERLRGRGRGVLDLQLEHRREMAGYQPVRTGVALLQWHRDGLQELTALLEGNGGYYFRSDGTLELFLTQRLGSPPGFALELILKLARADEIAACIHNRRIIYGVALPEYAHELDEPWHQLQQQLAA